MQDAAHIYPFLRAGEPPPVTVLNPHSTKPLLLIADHASNRIPEALNALGLGPEDLSRHIAFDVGVEPLTRALAERFHATTILHNYSRLILDPNRELDDPTSICVISDGTIVPGNRGLDSAAKRARAETFFHPYQNRVAREVERLSTGHPSPPPVIAVHSYTPYLQTGDWRGP